MDSSEFSLDLESEIKLHSNNVKQKLNELADEMMNRIKELEDHGESDDDTSDINFINGKNY